jgi:hypothetical protein
MVTYSLRNPTEKARMTACNAEGGKALIEEVLKSYNVPKSEVVVNSETEILLRSEERLPYEAKMKIQSLCDLKEL